MKNCRTTFQSLFSSGGAAGDVVPGPLAATVIAASYRLHPTIDRLLGVYVERGVSGVPGEAAVDGAAPVAQSRVLERCVQREIDERGDQEAQPPGRHAQDRRRHEHPEPQLLVEVLLDVEAGFTAPQTPRQDRIGRRP